MSLSVVGRAAAVITLGLCVGACAYATAIPVDYQSNTWGFRVYDIKPILIVNGQAVTIELVPNYNKAYAVNFGVFLAKQDFTLELEKGFVRKIDSKQDATAFIDLLRDLVKNFAPLATGKAMSGEVPGGITDRFQVYDFVFSDDGTLVGLRPLIDKRDLQNVRTTRLPGTEATAEVVKQHPQGDSNKPTPPSQ